MIVRDEAEMLPRFLSHAAGCYDELCAVDTGSRDDTVGLLERAGAKVVKEPWRDDFAAARNRGLAEAHGQWIVFADADELFSPELVADIRALADNERAGAATFVMHNQLPNGRIHRASLLRIFRNHPAIRFRFPIHEDVSDSVTDFLKTTSKELVALKGHADHLGYIRSRAAARDKRNRDRKILETYLTEHSTDLYCWFKLLELARFWGDQALWREKAQPAAEALRAAPRAALAHAYFGGELVALIAQGLYPARPKQAVDFMNSWQGQIAPSAAFCIRRAELYESCGQISQARQEFQSCLRLKDARDRERVTLRPLLGLSRLALAEGKIDDAATLVASAVQLNPRDPEALLAHIALARLKGGTEAVQTAVSNYTAAFGDNIEIHQALGEEAFVTGDIPTAVQELDLACGGKPTGQTGLRLAMAWLGNGEVERCRALLDELVRQYPEAALGIVVCDLIEGRDSKLEVDMEIDQASASLREWLEVVRRSPRRELLSALESNLGGLADLFPWVKDYRK
jgi:tetratricopeptide (TPR) repeat protein